MNFNSIFPISLIICIFLGFGFSFRYTYRANRLKAQEEERRGKRE